MTHCRDCKVLLNEDKDLLVCPACGRLELSGLIADERLDEIERRANDATVVEAWCASGIAAVNGGVVARVWNAADKELWLHAKEDVLALVKDIRRLRKKLNEYLALGKTVRSGGCDRCGSELGLVEISVGFGRNDPTPKTACLCSRCGEETDVFNAGRAHPRNYDALRNVLINGLKATADAKRGPQ